MFPLIGKTTAMRKAFDNMERAAQADCPVLIWGEDGTGKRLVAEAIHQRSRRASGPLVVVSAETTPGSTVEQRLFGDSPRSAALLPAEAHGCSDSVPGGTLLIEEITALASTAQARLLRVMENRGGSAAGRGASARPDFRLMATMRYDPLQSVERGTLREDLYYRLAVVVIRLPALRQRRDDVPLLIRHLLADLCAARARPVPPVEPALMDRLLGYSWPGNVDELRDCLASMVATGDAETLQVRHLPRSLAADDEPTGDTPRRRFDTTLADLERKAVMQALKTHQGNRTQTAKALGISVRTLQRKLRQWET